MQQPQGGFEHAHEMLLGCAPRLGIAALQAHLGQFEVPIAIVAPDEVVDRPRQVAEAIGLHGLGHLAHGHLQSAPDPAVGQFAALAGAWLVSVDIHQHKAGRIPQLVAKVAPGFRAGRSLHLVVFDCGIEAHILDSSGLR